MLLRILFLFTIILFVKTSVFSPFCNGDPGPTIFLENFGSGSNPGPELLAGTTTYDFGVGGGGLYYVTNDSGQNGTLWHSRPMIFLCVYVIPSPNKPSISVTWPEVLST